MEKKSTEVQINSIESEQDLATRPIDPKDYRDFIKEISSSTSVEDAREKFVRANQALRDIDTEMDSINKKDEDERKLLKELRQGLGMVNTGQAGSSHEYYRNRSDMLYSQSQEIRSIARLMGNYLATQPSAINEKDSQNSKAAEIVSDDKVEDSEVSQNQVEYMTTFKNSLSKLSEDLLGIQILMGKNEGFRRTNLQTENFPKLVRNDSFRPKELEEAFDFLSKELGKSFVSSEPHDRLMIEPEDYSRLVLKLEDIQGLIKEVKKQLEEYPIDGPDKTKLEDVVQKISNVNSAIENQKDGLQTMRKSLERYING